MGNPIHFSTSFTFCLASISAIMSGRVLPLTSPVDELEAIIGDVEERFVHNVVSLLSLLVFSYGKASNDVDRADYALGLQNILRLLCVLSYDPQMCRVLAKDEIEATKKEIRAHQDETSAHQDEEEETSQNPDLLLVSLYDVMEHLTDDAVATLLIMNIVRNMSCCSACGVGS